MGKPWTVEERNWCGYPSCPHGHVAFRILDGDGQTVARTEANDRARAEKVRANLRRIVAAVNAVEGTAVERVEADRSLKVIGDELLTACEAMTCAFLARAPLRLSDGETAALSQARVAIARAAEVWERAKKEKQP